MTIARTPVQLWEDVADPKPRFRLTGYVLLPSPSMGVNHVTFETLDPVRRMRDDVHWFTAWGDAPSQCLCVIQYTPDVAGQSLRWCVVCGACRASDAPRNRCGAGRPTDPALAVFDDMDAAIAAAVLLAHTHQCRRYRPEEA